MCESVYIHIPFCKTICSYCDFCKVFYNKEFVNKYLDSLELEVKTNYRGEKIRTIYIGGGTPSCLEVEELERLFQIINVFKKDKAIEFTIECNVETLTETKINLFINDAKYGAYKITNVEDDIYKNADIILRLEDKTSSLKFKFELNFINNSL